MVPAEQLTHNARAADAWYWAYHNKIMLKGKPFQLEGHEYQIDIMQCDARVQCAMKGAQMAFTESRVLKTLHGMIYGTYPQGYLYLFPTRDDVTDFSKGRFNPLIIDNPASIGGYLQNTDAANIKRIGNSMLYLRGARVSKKIEGIKKTASQLKSIPVDGTCFDEVDEMDSEMIELALQRMGHSEIKEESYLSTPSIPDFGIDKLYDSSDQRIWLITCRHCGHETCLELEFPNCLMELSDGKVIRICTKCRQEIYPCDGHWKVRFPEKSKDMVGWWISQLNSAYVNPADILKKFNNPPNGNLAEVYNSMLGMAYVAAENRLTTNDIYALCSHEVMRVRHPGPCCMGVDVGDKLHVIVGYHPNDTLIRAIYFARVSKFEELFDIAKRFHVDSCVIDLKPEIHKAREFQEATDFEVFLCDYQEHQRNNPAFDSKKGVVTMNRTELCDASHELVTTAGRYSIPRRNEEIEQYALEMANIAKVLEDDPETGSRTYRYRKIGPDHYRHATNYMLLAAMRIGVCEREEDDSKPKDKWADDEPESNSWMAA